MQLQVSGKHIEITDSVRKYVERKLGRLARHLPDVVRAEVEVTSESTRSPGHRYAVQVTLNCKGTLLRGEERASDLFTAINKVADIMNRQVERYKGRLYRKNRGLSPAKTVAGQTAPEGSTEVEARERIVRVKRFPIKPMPPQEAAEEMELLGHDFYFFLNSDTNELNVLYRRRDGDYGLIEPELGK